MSVRALVLSLALLGFGCHAPPSELPPNTVLQFGVGYRGGQTSFEVHVDGTAEYASSGGPPGTDKKVQAKATVAELEAIATVLRDNHFCSLRSGRSTGVPDEARPSVRVRMGELDCRVELWDGEWGDDPQAKACLTAIEALGSALSARGR